MIDLDAFIEHLRQSGTPEGRLPAFRRGAAFILEEVGRNPLSAKVVDAAIAKAEALGTDPKNLLHLKRIGSALIIFSKSPRTSIPPNSPAAPARTSGAPARTSIAPASTRGGAAGSLAPPSGDPLALTIDPLALNLDAIVAMAPPTPAEPAPNTGPVVAASLPPATAALLDPSAAQPSAARGIQALSNSAPDAAETGGKTLSARVRSLPRAWLIGGAIAVVALGVGGFMASSGGNGAQAASASGSASAAAPKAPTGPTKLRIAHIDLGVTIPAGWSYDDKFNVTQHMPGAHIKIANFFQGEGSETADRLLQCEVVWMATKEWSDVSQSSTNEELLTAIGKANNFQSRLKQAKGQAWSCEGLQIVRTGNRRAASCRGLTVLPNQREYKQLKFSLPVGHRMAICGAFDVNEISPQLEADALALVSSLEI